MKQPKMGAIGVSNGGDQEVVTTTVCSGSKRNGDAFETKNEGNKKVSHDNDKGKGVLELSDRDLHIWTEKERRKKLSNMFHQLHALLPQLPSKVDKCTILDETASYIKTLQQTLHNLHKKKQERLCGLSSNTTIASLAQLAPNTRESFLADQGSSSSHVGIVQPPNSTSVSSPISSPMIFQTWTSFNVTLNVCGLDAHISICSSLKPGLLTEICFVLERHNLEIVSTQISSDQYKSMLMIHAQANVGDQIVETFAYDEVFKQAATEIMFCVNFESS